MPRLRSGEQVAHGTLGQAEDGFSKQALADGVLAECVLDSPYKIVRIDFRVAVDLLLQ